MQQYVNLVELEKCCQTHIFLQNFVLIQSRTSTPKFAKFCKKKILSMCDENFDNFANFANFGSGLRPPREARGGARRGPGALDASRDGRRPQPPRGPRGPGALVEG